MKARTATNDLKLARVFHLSVYALACLSGGILTWAEGRALPGALTLPIAIAALILNEELQLVRLTGLWANVLALLAFVSPAFEFFGPARLLVDEGAAGLQQALDGQVPGQALRIETLRRCGG